jgi:hypothetical protein
MPQTQNATLQHNANKEQKVGIIELVTKRELRKTEDGLYDGVQKLYPNVRGAYSVTEGNNYASSFGFKWNKFQETRIERASVELEFSMEGFLITQVGIKRTLEKNILEVESGAGCCTQVVFETKNGNLYSIDYSDAVTVNHKNNVHYGSRLNPFQGASTICCSQTSLLRCTAAYA